MQCFCVYQNSSVSVRFYEIFSNHESSAPNEGNDVTINAVQQKLVQFFLNLI